MAISREVGFEKEKEAAKYLKKLSYRILETNFSSKSGEIDIIARDKNETVFIEVKYRENLSAGMPQEHVTAQKQRKIIKTAVLYMKKNAIKGGIRFDVVAILGDKIEVIKSAFSLEKYFI